MTIEELQAEIKTAQMELFFLENRKKEMVDKAWRARTFTERDEKMAIVKELDTKIENMKWRINRLEREMGNIENEVIEEKIEYDPENPTVEGLLDLLGE